MSIPKYDSAEEYSRQSGMGVEDVRWQKKDITKFQFMKTLFQ